MILPATLQGELPDEVGTTLGVTQGTVGRLKEICRRAEATGAASLWAVDHLFWPHPMNECFTTLAVAAAVTERPTLGTCVLQLPLRQPAAVAKQAAALQLLSGSRFILGVGVGSHAAEYSRAEVDFHRRGRLMDEGLDAIRRAWAPGVGPDALYPQDPPASTIPVWVGGSSAAARRRAAQVGDGWVPLFLTPDEYGPAVEALRRETEQAGREPDAVEPAVVVFARVGADDEAPALGAQWLSHMYGVPPKAFDRHLVSGEPESCAAALGHYIEAGARHIVIMVAAPGAVEHFGLLRSAFVARFDAIPVGVGG